MTSMKDIAKAAGVSRPTVSVVLGGTSSKLRISEETKRRVLDAASALGFKRNELAMAVKSGKSKTIAFIGGARTSYVMEIIAGINAAASEAGFTLKIFDVDNPAWNASEIAGKCLGQMVDGVICRSLSEEKLEALREEFEPRGVPLVLVDSSFEHDWCARVVSDDVDGAAQAVKHLVSLGLRRIGFASINPHSGYASSRREGFLKGLEESGLSFDPGLDFLQEGDWSEECDDAFQAYLSTARPDALLCSSDSIAMRAIQAATSLGIRIPEELSIMGYADLDFAQLSSPPLSTIAQPFVEMGRKSAEVLLKSISTGKPPRGSFVMPVKLIARKSTARKASI